LVIDEELQATDQSYDRLHGVDDDDDDDEEEEEEEDMTTMTSKYASKIRFHVYELPSSYIQD